MNYIVIDYYMGIHDFHWKNGGNNIWQDIK